MAKRVVIAGLSGFLVMVLWGFVVNGVFRFNRLINMKEIPNERLVYDVLKENVVEPGRYDVNPELTSDRAYPAGEPVFSILYSGLGHEAAGRVMLFQFAIFLLTPMIAAWMLSLTSERILASYPRKVLFFTAIGLLFGLYGNLMDFGIGGYPLRDALLLAVHDIVLWTLVGATAAWWLRPEAARNPS